MDQSAQQVDGVSPGRDQDQLSDDAAQSNDQGQVNCQDGDQNDQDDPLQQIQQTEYVPGVGFSPKDPNHLLKSLPPTVIFTKPAPKIILSPTIYFRRRSK